MRIPASGGGGSSDSGESGDTTNDGRSSGSSDDRSSSSGTRPTQRQRDLLRGSGDTLESHEKTSRSGSGTSQRERDHLRGSGDTLSPEETSSSPEPVGGGGGGDGLVDRFRSGVNDTADTVGNTFDRGRDAVGSGVDRTRDFGSDITNAGTEVIDRGVSEVHSEVDDLKRRADEELRERTDGEVGVSDDVTSTEGSGGVRGIADEGVREISDGEVGISDDFTSTDDSGGVRNTADTGLREASGGEVGVSDDFTTTDDWFGNAEFDRDLATDLSRGGVLSEGPDDNSGLLPGEALGADISEDRLRGAAEWGDDYKDQFDEGGDFLGSSRAESALQGAAGMGVDLLNVPQHVLTAEGAAETVQNTPGAISEYGASSYAETATIFGRDAGQAMVDEAKADPVKFGSGAAFGYVTGAAAGRVAGQAGRAVRDRGRTAGGKRIDPTDLAGEGVVRHVETDGAEGKRFPDADDPDTYQTDPATAVRDQADDYTPAAVSDFFDEQGVSEGTVMKKALDTEPDGPGTGRSDSGFTSAPDEVGGDFAYETPGSFFGPELSPNFLRAEGGEASFSFRPGLPDFGNKPTGVLARTDVENPDADNLQAFNQEIMDNAGDTTAYTKPADEVNVGEIEAVVPPGGEFSPVSGGGAMTDFARRAGIGSDFYTEIGGRRVPLRTVAPADKTPDADVDAGGGGLFGDTDAGGESLDYYVETPDQPVDRPVPMGLSGAEGASSSGAGTSAETGYDSAAPEPDYGPAPTDVDDGYGTFDTDSDYRPPSDPEPTTSSPGPGRPRDRDSGTSSGAGSETDFGPFGGPSSGGPPSDGGESAPPSGPPSSPPPSSPPPSRGSPVGGPPSSPPPVYEPPISPPPARGPDDKKGDEMGWREPEPVEAETPEYFNPIASGTGDLFGGGFGETSDGDARGNGEGGEADGFENSLFF